MRIWFASAAAGTAAASIAAGAVTVSGPTPFSSCRDDPRTVVPNAEVEPSLAVDPRRPARAYVAYQQDRFRDGAARGIVVALARVKQDLLDDLVASGLADAIGRDRLYPTLPTALTAYTQWRRSSAEAS